jgi:hypothetical protein
VPATTATLACTASLTIPDSADGNNFETALLSADATCFAINGSAGYDAMALTVKLREAASVYFMFMYAEADVNRRATCPVGLGFQINDGDHGISLTPGDVLNFDLYANGVANNWGAAQGAAYIKASGIFIR